MVVGRGKGVMGWWGAECECWGVAGEGRRPGLWTMYWSGLISYNVNQTNAMVTFRKDRRYIG